MCNFKCTECRELEDSETQTLDMVVHVHQQQKHLTTGAQCTRITGYISPYHILLTAQQELKNYMYLFVSYMPYLRISQDNQVFIEPLLKQLNLLKVKDMIDLKLLKFLHKLNASKLPQYFNSYRPKPYLEKNETKYNLRPNPLVMPAVNHVYAENLLIYRLVKLKNMFSLHYPLVDDKLNDGTHSLVGFGRYIAKVIIDKYSYQCSNNPCLPCGRL